MTTSQLTVSVLYSSLPYYNINFQKITTLKTIKPAQGRLNSWLGQLDFLGTICAGGRLNLGRAWCAIREPMNMTNL